MAENRNKDLFQYNFDEEWDVEREMYGRLLKQSQMSQDVLSDDVYSEPSPADKSYRETARQERSTRAQPQNRATSAGIFGRSHRPTREADTAKRESARSREPSRGGETNRMPPQPRKTGNPPRKKKQGSQINYKALAILIAMALVAILVIFGMVRFFMWIISPAEGDRDAEESSTSETVITTTVDYEAIAAELLEQAELQSAMYDYDTAIKTVKSFGSNWGTRADLTQAVQKYEQLKLQTVRWEDTTTIPHIFFHILVADNARAFDGDYTEDGYNQYMTTIPEFKAILEELYARDYVLIRIHDIAKRVTDENGNEVYEQGDIYLPPGKKPIVISQDDVNFYEYMIDSDGDHLPDAGGDGFASKLLVDAHGDITCEYVTAEGETVYGDYDLVPILERFVEEHPDFSYRGAKAIVALTGYEGVYGYRTDKDGKERLTPEEFRKEIDGAKAVNQWLKDNGWEIASHSYGHPSYGSLTWEELAHDVSRWEEEVQPVVGDTDIFIYPYGSDIAGVENYSGSKYDTMYEAGYRFYCNVDSSEYWVHIRNNYVRQGRRNLDGYRMWYDPELLDDLFDATAIFDPDRPTPVPPI